jgi:hypothetical protein
MYWFAVFLSDSEREHLHAYATECYAVHQDNVKDGDDIFESYKKTVYQIIHWL